MPFKILTSLEKIGQLEGEVTGLATHQPAGLMAAVSSDPVVVSTHPFASAGSKQTRVSLDEAQGIALLNKQVAVVKSGDALWALLDIQHKPKMEQVGRDIRALYSCPDGETALAVGWDGNGAALAFANREVGGRQFVLRGDVRACCLADRMTYVAVDTGSAGGQLRVHPGTTPESGATTRTDLPASAGRFDQLAGGRELSALSSAGSDQVCLVAREGASALTVKQLGVAGGVADLAVIATSLFVLGQDGKLRLFAAAGIAGTAEGQMLEPTAELDLGASGPPTVLVATTKGGNRLWVGTRGGEVLRCDAIKRGLDL